MMTIAARLAALRGWRRGAVASLLGLIAAGALPPLPGVALLIPAFTGLVLLIGERPRPWAAIAAGWWFGFGHFGGGLYWVGSAFLVDAQVYGWMAPIAVVGLAAGMALFPALAAAVLAVPGLWGVGRILALAVAWTATEWLRGWVLTGFPWNLMGTVWFFSDGMIQSAMVAGVYGLSLLTVAAAAMPAVLADGRAGWGQRASAVLAAAAALGAVYTAGVVRLAHAGGEVVPDVRLRLVQPAIPQGMKWSPELRQRHVLDQLALSTRPPVGGASPRPPSHIVWAETAVPFFLSLEPGVTSLIGSAAPENGLMIVGAPRTDSDGRGPGRVWNSFQAVDARGRVVATYDKAHLVPFGEYVPFRSILDIEKLTAGRGDFTPGAGRATLRLAGLPPVSPLICYEVIFPGGVVDAADRPRWMLNLTNDAWFGTLTGPHQHFAAARFRAVEEGMPLVRVANTGISGVVDAYGRVVAHLGLGQRGIVDSDLPVALASPPPYGRWGDWVLFGLLTVVMLAAWFACCANGGTPPGKDAATPIFS